MSLKDRFDRFIDYFTEDEDDMVMQEQASTPQPTVVNAQPKSAPVATPTRPVREQSTPVAEPVRSVAQSKPTPAASKENITRLHARQQELAQQHPITEKEVTIDVRYPRHYEEATDIVDLLIANESILIDFQYMTEVQARRCLDYLDGARYVLAGNLKKVASTMYLLTPINVVVNIEDIQLPDGVQISDFGFDMKQRS